MFELYIKYLLEGIAVAIAAYFIPRKKVDISEVIFIALSAAATFAVLDIFAPKVGDGARKGAGFGIGANTVGWPSGGAESFDGSNSREDFAYMPQKLAQPAKAKPTQVAKRLQEDFSESTVSSVKSTVSSAVSSVVSTVTGTSDSNSTKTTSSDTNSMASTGSSVIGYDPTNKFASF